MLQDGQTDASELLASANARAPDPKLDLEFLQVDGFIRTLVDARALKTAFELGLVDHLVEARSSSLEALGKALQIDRGGLRFLLDLLGANQVVEERAGKLRLSRPFARVLQWRDLLETKLDFAGIAMNDFADHFTEMVRSSPGAALKGQLFELFDYRRCIDPSIENHRRTRAWMRLTSTLTRYEAQACLRLHDFSGHRRLLDVGGNSGEFILQLCKRYPGLRGTVFDLPLVCEVGVEHLLAEPEQARISFIKGDIRKDPLPAGHDLVTFKSMLHDWPLEDVDRFLAKAVRVLEPGGTLMVFERGPIQAAAAVPPFSMLPILLFFRSYRSPAAYMAKLEALGMLDIELREIALDTPFFLVRARKPG
jgi:SAM-dependent methyltransferase